jgi:sulfur carrier protein
MPMEKIEIIVNGESRHVEPGTSLAKLLLLLGFRRRGVAVELNDEIAVPDAIEGRILQPRDRVEIVSFIGGG